MKKTYRQLERYFKGVSCHRRIEILDYLNRSPNSTLEDIAVNVKANPKTTAEHTKRLKEAGLINKHYVGKCVAHSLSPYGEKIHKFISTFE